MKYWIDWAGSTRRELRDLPERERRRVWDRIQKLADDPRPAGMESLKGERRGWYRIRAGNYRVVYQIEKDVVVIVKIDKRGRIYKRL